MITRHHLALEYDDHDMPPLQAVAEAISAGQRDIFATGGESADVRTDAAICLMVSKLARLFDCEALDSDLSAYAGLSDLINQNVTSPGELTPHEKRRWRDAHSAQEGAVNVGAMCASLSRHAAQMTEGGATSEQIYNDQALRAITHQVGFLCGVNLATDAEVLLHRNVCRSVVAAQTASETIKTLDAIDRTNENDRRNPTP